MSTMISAMHIARPFMSGRSQAIRIPKEYRMDSDEVIINRVGESLMITPLDAMQKLFYEGLAMFTDDFMSEGRPEESPNEKFDL